MTIQKQLLLLLILFKIASITLIAPIQKQLLLLLIIISSLDVEDVENNSKTTFVTVNLHRNYKKPNNRP